MKKFITFALIAAMMLTMIVVGTSAAAWDGTSVSTSLKGEGTEASPYLVESAADLAFLAKSVNEGTNYAGKYITQTADIDLGGKEWTPIGYCYSFKDSASVEFKADVPFSGVYNGCGYSVTGLSITKNTLHNVGLFGYISSAAGEAGVANLTVEGAIAIDNPAFAYTNSASEAAAYKDNGGLGALVGWVNWSGKKYDNKAYFTNITTDVSITLTNCGMQYRLGGVAGQPFYAIFENVVNNGNISYTGTATTRIAGMAGQTNSCTYKGCVNNGDITVNITADQTARACGFTSVVTVGPDADIYTEFLNCVNNGNIEATTGNNNTLVAGIAGDAYPAGASTRLRITNCVNTGNMTSHVSTSASGKYAHTGGIGAYFGNNNHDIYVTGCVNTGEIAYTSFEGAQNRACGLIGSIYSPGHTDKFVLSNCITTKSTMVSQTYNIGYNVDKGAYRIEMFKTNIEPTTEGVDVVALATAAIKTIEDAIVPSTYKIAGFDTAYKAPAAPETTTPAAPETTTPSTPSIPSTPNTGDVTSVIVLALVAVAAGAVLTIKKAR